MHRDVYTIIFKYWKVIAFDSLAIASKVILWFKK